MREQMRGEMATEPTGKYELASLARDPISQENEGSARARKAWRLVLIVG